MGLLGWSPILLYGALLVRLGPGPRVARHVDEVSVVYWPPDVVLVLVTGQQRPDAEVRRNLGRAEFGKDALIQNCERVGEFVRRGRVSPGGANAVERRAISLLGGGHAVVGRGAEDASVAESGRRHRRIS